jgi:hypothetical protein
MKSLKESLVPALIGAVLSGLGALVLGIYSDLLPVLLPSLQGVAVATYIKVVLLLLLLLACAVALAIVLYQKTKPYHPRALSGKDFGFNWSAELDYNKKREEVEIELQWVCPKHKVFLGVKDAKIPNTAYYRLWCDKCNEFHDMTSGGAPVYVQEAERIIRRKILSKLKL